MSNMNPDGTPTWELLYKIEVMRNRYLEAALREHAQALIRGILKPIRGVL